MDNTTQLIVPMVWSAYVPHNHNTTECTALEKVALAILGADHIDGRAGRIDGSRDGIEIEVTAQHPDSSPNTKNRIDEKNGRIRVQEKRGTWRGCVVYLFKNQKQINIAKPITFEEETIFGCWDPDAQCYRLTFHDGTPVTEFALHWFFNAL